MFGRLLLGMFLVHQREFAKAEDLLTQVIEYNEKEGTKYLKTIANMFLGVTLAAQRKLGEGVRLVESASGEFMEFQRNIFHIMSETILGNIYLQILQKSEGKTLSSFCKNIGFLVKNYPVARRKAERHLTTAIQLAKATGAKGFLGQPCMQLGLLFKLTGKRKKAKEYLLEAIRVFEECEFEVYLNRAKELLHSLA
jgi:tetratricopeptide (TPR) repeat protein